MVSYNARSPAKSGAINIHADLTGMGEFIGKTIGITATMQSEYSRATMVKSTWAFGAEQFNALMDATSGATAGGSEKLSHMYDWGLEGTPPGRLWRHTLSGHGGSRTASFRFINSRRAIPVPSMEGWTTEAKEAFGKLKNKRYVFHSKAPIMEYGIPTEITPRDGARIFIPFRNGEGYTDGGKGYVFAERARVRRSNSANTGQFTQQWQTFWSGQGQGIFETRVAPMLEKGIAKVATAGTGGMASAGRVSSGLRNFELSVDTGAAKASAALKAEFAGMQQRADFLERMMLGG